ncbi:hypothetical protein HPB51_010248 [Rhipicephalus microplus]|uniref:Uncharacterized protein n=1 Tax=Rhipicephalus microplus TaxID=6941 RepID=A0A9J6D4V5_RHIMP|nr:hypothetical protein HPB51_010248 [Rhipicephalus microplus]
MRRQHRAANAAQEAERQRKRQAEKGDEGRRQDAARNRQRRVDVPEAIRASERATRERERWRRGSGSYLDGGRPAHRSFTHKKNEPQTKPERTREGTREEKRKVSRPSACRRSTKQPSQAGLPAQKTPRTDAPSKGRHKGYPVTTQGPHSEKSIWIGALYSSDRGLPEQLWRRKFVLWVHPGSNIIISSTPHEQVSANPLLWVRAICTEKQQQQQQVVGRLREINQLKIRGQIHPFNAYVADPEDLLRGIVHGLLPGTTQADLRANLRIRPQGVKIERARMLGSSKSAIITFTGDVLPSSVYFMGAEAICYRYKPTVQVCKICRSTGHQTDVFPTLNANVCSRCRTGDPTQGHECALNCAICGEEHATGDKTCRKKLKNVVPRISRAGTPRRQTECIPTPRRISRNLSNTSRNLLVGSAQTEKNDAPEVADIKIQFQITIKIKIDIKDPATAKQQQACGGPWQAKLEENTEQQLGNMLRQCQERRSSRSNH